MSSLEENLKRIRIAADRLRLRLGDREMHEVFEERIAAVAEWLEMVDHKIHDDQLWDKCIKEEGEDTCSGYWGDTGWDIWKMAWAAEDDLIRAFTREGES